MRRSLAGFLITQAIAFVGCVVVPVAITLVAPLSTLEFRRADGGIEVAVTRYALILVPWRTTRVGGVTQLRADITPEVHRQLTAEDRRKGRAHVSYATGQLAILGEAPVVIVQAAPDLAKEIAARFERFRRDANAPPETVEVYASWSLSYLLGGAVSALCAFYLLGVFLAVVTYPFKRKAAT